MKWTTKIALAISHCKRKGYMFDGMSERRIINQAIVNANLEGWAARIAYNCIKGQVDDSDTSAN